MINIVLNGEDKSISKDTNIDQLLKDLDLENVRLAVEINKEIIPRSSYNLHVLNEHDVIEIVQAIGG
ncbi:MAG: sulfur carrier protein ThiS, partial [Thiotrichaceae bacterium]|nr:sulfur carrier protein ThiS [Thiotrichaceae bacterium]